MNMNAGEGSGPGVEKLEAHGRLSVTWEEKPLNVWGVKDCVNDDAEGSWTFGAHGRLSVTRKEEPLNVWVVKDGVSDAAGDRGRWESMDD